MPVLPAGGGGGSQTNGPPGGGNLSGVAGGVQVDEMTTLFLGDTLTFWASLSQYSTGAAMDVTGNLSYRIYEEATDTPLLTGNMAVQDDSNTVGFYQGQVSITALNGFEVNKCYCVRVAGTVDAIAQAGIVERFIVRAAASVGGSSAMGRL